MNSKLFAQVLRGIADKSKKLGALVTVFSRTLAYRSFYKSYFNLLSLLWVISCVGFTWSLYEDHSLAKMLDLLWVGWLIICIPPLLIFALRPKILTEVHVFDDRLVFSSREKTREFYHKDLVELKFVWNSLFWLKYSNDEKLLIDSSLERTDYILEAIWKEMPNVVGDEEYYQEKLKLLIKRDHQEKRKEWFFKYKMLDLVNWVIVPIFFLFTTWIIQSEKVQIQNVESYFARLIMLMMIIISSVYYLVMVVSKNFVFHYFLSKAGQENFKRRNISAEREIVYYLKIFQTAFIALVLFISLGIDVNLFSLVKLEKSQAQKMGFKDATTIIVDSRYNCLGCHFGIESQDWVFLKNGQIVQVLGVQGDTVALEVPHSIGRSIASETLTTIPTKHIAAKLLGRENGLAIIPISDLVGRVKK